MSDERKIEDHGWCTVANWAMTRDEIEMLAEFYGFSVLLVAESEPEEQP